MTQDAEKTTYPQILWDCGTVYDFFISLDVLHKPARFGVRPAWTAGMRARLSQEDRETLKQSQILLKLLGFHFLHHLPEPKDSTALLWTLSQLSPEQRLSLMIQSVEGHSPETAQILSTVLQQRAWNERDKSRLKTAYVHEPKTKKKKEAHSSQELTNILEWFAHPEESGERYLKALRAYYDVFFAEEEKRIRPALKKALERAQELAEKLSFPDLLEELSQGLRMSDWQHYSEVVLAPSYWSTPLLYYGQINAECGIYIFGARPPQVSLVPGETVPDFLMKALKALSDPTRLCILQYLANEPLSPAQLVRRLRLRAPTITHHLNTLRLAGLVKIVVDKEKGISQYTARTSAVKNACTSLESFLKKCQTEDTPT